MEYSDESVYLLALLRAYRGLWHRIAALVENAGTAKGFVTGEVRPPNDLAREVCAAVTPRHVDQAASEVAAWSRNSDMEVWSVLDHRYPSSLRSVFNRPPLLFCRGTWDDAVDSQGLAVVGTRRASQAGLEQARSVARELAARSVTVISGLALGVDGAAHASALDHGGRTVAVLGSGLDVIYPRDHAELADRIVEEGGALISQFVPNQPPTRQTFPMRNVVTSGLGRGTIVIEAGERSGAKMQARLALEHGRTLFVPRSLVERSSWAADYAERGRRGSTAVVVDSVDEVLRALGPPDDHTLQMNLFQSVGL